MKLNDEGRMSDVVLWAAMNLISYLSQELEFERKSSRCFTQENLIKNTHNILMARGDKTKLKLTSNQQVCIRIIFVVFSQLCNLKIFRWFGFRLTKVLRV